MARFVDRSASPATINSVCGGCMKEFQSIRDGGESQSSLRFGDEWLHYGLSMGTWLSNVESTDGSCPRRRPALCASSRACPCSTWSQASWLSCDPSMVWLRERKALLQDLADQGLARGSAAAIACSSIRRYSAIGSGSLMSGPSSAIRDPIRLDSGNLIAKDLQLSRPFRLHPQCKAGTAEGVTVADESRSSLPQLAMELLAPLHA